METPHRRTFFKAIYGSLDSAVNLMKESHSNTRQYPTLGEGEEMGAQDSGKVMEVTTLKKYFESFGKMQFVFLPRFR